MHGFPWRADRRSLLGLGAIAAASLVLPSLPALAAAGSADVTAAQEQIGSLADQAIGILKATTPESAERRTQLATLLHGNFNLPYLAQLAVGRPWRDLSEAERQNFIDIFSKWVVDSQSRRLATYAGETVEVTGAEPVGDNDVMVHSRISGGTLGEPVAVDWRMRKTGSKFEIIDVVIAGVSMVVTYRQEFSSIVQQGGVDALIAELQARSAQAS
jgi:phospholipid transport system substrate-binding protein